MSKKPRVEITYKVETEGAEASKELPFVVGVTADLSGQPKAPLKPLAERKFEEIDPDNFDARMAAESPRFSGRVKNKLTGGDDLITVEFEPKKMDDFDPGRLAELIPVLSRLLEERQRLHQLLLKAERNEEIKNALAEILSNTKTTPEGAPQSGAAVPPK